MSLTIGRMVVGGTIPRRWAGAIPAVERTARTALPAAWASQLPAVWGSRPPICRIKRLHVRVRIAGRQLTDTGLTQASTDAFVRTLLIALDQSTDRGDLLFAANRGEWLAHWLVRRLGGDPETWAFAALSDLNAGSYDNAVASIVTRFPSDVGDLLASLAGVEELERWLAATSPGTHEGVCDAIDRTYGPRRPSALPDLIAIARLAVPRLRSGRRRLGTTATAIQLFAAARHGSTEFAGHLPPPGAILQMLRALDYLVADNGAARCSSDGEFASFVRALTTAVGDAGLAATIARALTSPDADPTSDAAELKSLVLSAREAIGSPAGPAVGHAIRIDLRHAGLFLTVSTIASLGWLERARRSTFWAIHGSRALTYIVFGTALALLNRSSVEADDGDRSASLFAGWLVEPAPGAYRQALSQGDERMRTQLLTDLDAATPGDGTGDWQQTFALLADRVASAFAARLRGFRRSSRAFIVERFLKSPGRVIVNDDTIVVRLEANPFWSAAHASGVDTPIDAVPWLGGRRIEFELEGL